MSGGRVVLAVVCVVWGGGIVLTSLVFGGALVLAGARTLLDVRR